MHTNSDGQAEADDTHSKNLIPRLFAALDYTDVQLAKKFDIPLADIRSMRRGSRSELGAVDSLELFEKLIAYIDSQLGALFAVREELQRKFTTDIKLRQARRDRILKR